MLSTASWWKAPNCGFVHWWNATDYGWRVSELLEMRVSQADLLQRTIRLEPGTTKNTEGREVVMTMRSARCSVLSVTGKRERFCVHS